MTVQGSWLPSDFKVSGIGAIREVAFQCSLEIVGDRPGKRRTMIQNYQTNVVQLDGCQSALCPSRGIFVEVKKNAAWIMKARKKVNLRGIRFRQNVFPASM